jgi:acetyl-CoA acetyltransferase
VLNSRPTPKWVDGTAVGGWSPMIHVRHAAAAIASGLCETVLTTHGESGRSGVGRTRNVVAPTSLAGQFRAALWANGAADFVHDPGIALHEDL